MEREYIYELFEGKSIPYVFNRIKVDDTLTFARSTITVRGSLLEEDLGLTNTESLVVELLLGDQFVDFYQYLINVSYDKTTRERKLLQFSISLYSWTSKRLGYIPDWILKDRVLYIKDIIDKMLKEKDNILTDSEVLLGILLKNTNFSRGDIFEEQLAKGVWEKTETSRYNLIRAEDYYLKGQSDMGVDSLSLYERMAERGYRDVDILDRYLESKEFKELVITDVEKVQDSIRDYMWQYKKGKKWVSFTDKFFNTVTTVDIEGIDYERVNPNQVMLRDRREGYTVQFTFSDKIVVNIRNQQRLEVVYNEHYYIASYDDITASFKKYEHLSSRFIKIIGVLLKYMPMEIPKKGLDLEKQ